MQHVVLLGDSIFDNAAYVSGGPDVLSHLQGLLQSRAKATLLAVDGAVIADVSRQLTRIPPDATHLVVSAGGNDALQHTGLLDRRARTSAEVLEWFGDAVEAFEQRYRRMLASVLALGIPRTVCTIYNGNLGVPVQRVSTVALAIFNDAIQRVAHDGRLLPQGQLPLPAVGRSARTAGRPAREHVDSAIGPLHVGGETCTGSPRLEMADDESRVPVAPDPRGLGTGVHRELDPEHGGALAQGGLQAAA